MSALSMENMISYVPVVLPLLLAGAGWALIQFIRLAARWPQRFFGIKHTIGWQGYFHANQHLYVTNWSRELFEKLSGLQQVFEYLGPEKLITHQLSNIRPQIDGLIDDVMNEDNAVMWENLPVLVKNRFYLRAHRMLPRIVDDIIEELGDGLSRSVSYPRLLEQAERDQPGTLQRLYDILSERAFQRLTRFAVGLGFVAGTIQLVVAVMLQVDSLEYWAISSAFIVFFFFWLGQRWLHYPSAPITLWRWQFRSPFSAFRTQQDDELAVLLSESVLSVRNIFNTLLHGTRARHARTIIRRRVSTLVEDINVRTLVQLTVGPLGYLELKKTLTDKLTDAILEPLEEDQFNQERSVLVEHFMKQRLSKLSDDVLSQQLWRILQPLSIIGGIGGFWLGGATGALQWLLLTF